MEYPSGMARIVVLGGSGFLGSRVVQALRAAGLEVMVASRRSEVRVDVTQPSTFSALGPFELVVDLSDTVTNPPDALVAWCLEQGKCVLSATSDAPCIERLYQSALRAKHGGTLILGGGIFTGLSNLLGRNVVKGLGSADALTLGISSSPFSGSGGGTVALMVNALEVPAVRYENGQRIDEPKIRSGPLLDFAGVQRPTGYMSFPESFMLHHSTHTPTVDVLFAPKPGFLVSAFTMLPGWVMRKRWFQAFMRGYFTVLRRFLLQSVSSSVELVAIARVGSKEVRRWLKATDGMLAGGYALAAMAEVLSKKLPKPGVYFIDDVTELEPIVERVNLLAGSPMVSMSNGEK